jgi:N-acetylglucosamine kinase-like BadF-type ATPase
MKYILGVDGGGTKTLALLGNIDGDVLARGISGPSNYNAVGFEVACSALESAVNAACSGYAGEISALCLGLSGAGRKEDIERFRNWAVHKFPKALVQVVSDAEILLQAGAPSGPGLALICGTGSVGYGRTVKGELIRAGGWGYLFGDEGSGFAIGVAALQAVTQAYDGRGRQTLLSDLVLRRYNLRTPPELVREIYDNASPQLAIASLADLVEQAAVGGDSVAVTILEKSAQELARIVAAVYSKLGTSAAPLAIAGGTILHGRHLMKAFHQACRLEKLRFTTVHNVAEPARGALTLALRLLLG